MGELVHSKMAMWQLIPALSFAALMIIEIVRAIPPFRDWALDGKKPWGCDLCSSFWASIAVSALLVIGDDLPTGLKAWVEVVMATTASGGLTLFLLTALGRLRVASSLPPLE